MFMKKMQLRDSLISTSPDLEKFQSTTANVKSSEKIDPCLIEQRRLSECTLDFERRSLADSLLHEPFKTRTAK